MVPAPRQSRHGPGALPGPLRAGLTACPPRRHAPQGTGSAPLRRANPPGRSGGVTAHLGGFASARLTSDVIRPGWGGRFVCWSVSPSIRPPLGRTDRAAPLPRPDLSRLSAPFRRHTSGTARRSKASEALRLPGANRERESGLRLREAWKRGRGRAWQGAEMEVIPFGAERFGATCTR